jgi:hypothetical protein
MKVEAWEEHLAASNELIAGLYIFLFIPELGRRIRQAQAVGNQTVSGPVMSARTRELLLRSPPIYYRFRTEPDV